MHHPFQDIGSPTHQPTLCIPPSKSVPLKSHQEKRAPPSRTAQPPCSQLAIPVFILVSLLACKCPGSSPGSHNPCSSHTFAPTTSRDLGSSVPPLCGIKCTSNCRAGRGEMTMQIFMSFPGTLGVAQEMSAFQKVTLFQLEETNS